MSWLFLKAFCVAKDFITLIAELSQPPSVSILSGAKSRPWARQAAPTRRSLRWCPVAVVAVVGSPYKDCSPVCVHDPVVVVADVAAILVICPRLVARRYQGTLHCLAKREPVAQLLHLQG